MTEALSPNGYIQTKRKLARLEERLAAIGQRKDLDADRMAEVRRSYETMIRQYRREIKLYEAETNRVAADVVPEQR